LLKLRSVFVKIKKLVHIVTHFILKPSPESTWAVLAFLEGPD